MKLETHNSNPPSANETVEDPLEKGSLDTASTESDEYPVEVKSSEEPSKESRKEYLLDTDSRNEDSAPTGINDDGFWPVAEFGDPKSAEVKMVEEKTEEYLEVPEIVVCYKESPELNIKDICIDDNMSSCEKILFERDTDKEDLCSFLGEKDSITEFKEEADVSVQDVSTHDHDVVDGDKSVKTVNTMQEAAVEVPDDLSDDIGEENIQETVKEPSEEPCPLPSSVDAGVENNSNRDYDNFQSKNISMVSYSDTDLFREQHGLGESSFSMAGPMSNLITYSGPIVHSSRSDASSASTRSFAFPVLYPEWQSSPVRLPRADRGNLRKPKWWRHGLLCCRF